MEDEKRHSLSSILHPQLVRASPVLSKGRLKSGRD